MILKKVDGSKSLKLCFVLCINQFLGVQRMIIKVLKLYIISPTHSAGKLHYKYTRLHLLLQNKLQFCLQSYS